VVSLVASTLFSPGIDHLFDLLLVVGIKLVELSEEGLPEYVLVGFSRFVEQVIRRDGEGFGDSRQLFARRLACISVFELPKVAFAGIPLTAPCRGFGRRLYVPFISRAAFPSRIFMQPSVHQRRASKQTAA
jgi:hypothetical protein